MMADLIAGILGKIKNGNFQQASQSIDNAYQDFLKEDAGFFRKIPIKDLTENLIMEHNYTHGHLEILSALFYAQGELSFAEGNQKESLQNFEKSFVLLDFILKESKSFSVEKQSRRTHIQERIKELKTRSS